MKEIIKKYNELISYGVFGVLTTVINYIAYVLFTRVFDLEIVASNFIAWVISVIFAFFTNKLLVFKSKKMDFRVVLKEISSFFIARIFSLVLDMLILYLMSEVIGINDLIVKIISNIIVIIVNYIISKFIIFKK